MKMPARVHDRTLYIGGYIGVDHEVIEDKENGGSWLVVGNYYGSIAFFIKGDDLVMQLGEE